MLFKRLETLEKIASFLEIKFNEGMELPTHLQTPWLGNSGTGIKMKSIDVAPSTYWKDRILPVEVYYVNKLFGHILDQYNYERLPTKGSFLERDRGEGMKTYLRNRIFKIFTDDWAN